MVTFIRRHAFKLVIVGGIILALVGFATYPAHAARSWAAASYRPKVPVQRVGLDCRHAEYLIWGARYCVTLRARKVQGRWWVQPAAAVAGYNAKGRRAMGLVAAVRMDGRTDADASKAKRLVVRGPWRVGTGGADGTRAVFVIRWPNGHKSAVKLSPNG